MATSEHVPTNEVDELLEELSTHVRISHAAENLKRELASLKNPDGNMLLHTKQNDVLIEHSNQTIARLEARVKALHPEAMEKPLSPEEAIDFHQQCYDQLCIMRALMLADNMSGKQTSIHGEIGDHGDVTTYLDVFIQRHDTKIKELQSRLRA